MKTYDEIKQIVLEEFSNVDNIPVLDIDEDKHVINDLNTSCIGRCRLQLAFKNKIGVLMPSDLAVHANTVKDVIDYMFENQQ